MEYVHFHGLWFLWRDGWIAGPGWTGNGLHGGFVFSCSSLLIARPVNELGREQDCFSLLFFPFLLFSMGRWDNVPPHIEPRRNGVRGRQDYHLYILTHTHFHAGWDGMGWAFWLFFGGGRWFGRQPALFRYLFSTKLFEEEREEQMPPGGGEVGNLLQ